MYKKALILVLIVLVAIILLAVFFYQKNEIFPQKQNNDNLALDSFAFSKNADGYYSGIVNVDGYLHTQSIECIKELEIGPICDDDVEYAFFVIQSSESNAIFEFIDENEGNAFMSPLSVGLGCIERSNKRLHSINISDEGEYYNEITGDDFDALIESTQFAPVSVKMTRSVTSEGMGAPQCFSHFREIEVSS